MIDSPAIWNLTSREKHRTECHPRRSLKVASGEQVLATGDAHQLQLCGEWLLPHADGIRSRLQVENFLPTRQTTLQQLADGMLASWSRETDDSTIVVIRRAG